MTITIQQDLDKLGIWEQIWKITLHRDKCNATTISRNKHLINYTAEISTLLITLTPYMVIYADSASYLGVTVQSNLKWDNHIKNICNKGNITLDLLT